MKVCFFNTIKSWGGGEKWHYENALALSERGHDVSIIVYPNSELHKKVQSSGIKYIPLNVGNISFLNCFKRNKLYDVLNECDFDSIIFNTPTDVKFAAAVAERAGIKKRILRRGSALPVKDCFINHLAFSHLTGIIVNSLATKESLLASDSGFISQLPIKLLYNGVHMPVNVEKKKENTPIVIGNLGRMVYQKGQDILLRIARILKDRGVQFKMRIGGIGDIEEKLHKMTLDLDIEDVVEFFGFVADTERFLQSVDIFALTSRGEGFGNVLAEAMVMKLPIVSFDVSSAPELVKNEYNGYLVPMNDLEGYADKLQSLIQNAEERKTMGTNGFALASENFDFERNVDLLEEILLN